MYEKLISGLLNNCVNKFLQIFRKKSVKIKNPGSPDIITNVSNIWQYMYSVKIKLLTENLYTILFLPLVHQISHKINN